MFAPESLATARFQYSAHRMSSAAVAESTSFFDPFSANAPPPPLIVGSEISLLASTMFLLITETMMMSSALHAGQVMVNVGGLAATDPIVAAETNVTAI